MNRRDLLRGLVVAPLAALLRPVDRGLGPDPFEGWTVKRVSSTLTVSQDVLDRLSPGPVSDGDYIFLGNRAFEEADRILREAYAKDGYTHHLFSDPPVRIDP